jgi:nitrate/nitrite transporter NarK
VSLFGLFFEGLFILFFYLNDTYLWLDILLLAFIGIFNQCANGACYAIVPYVQEGGTGAVSGFVGAGGSIGSITWSIMFMALKMEKGFLYLSIIVMLGSLSTLAIKVKGYAGLIFGEDENLLLRGEV